MRGSRYPPAPTKKTSVENTLVFCFIRYLKFHPQGWIRTAAATSLKTAQKQPSATATTAASGRSREELLGLRPAGCACRPRHDAAAGSRDPGSFLFCAARDIHPRPQKTSTYHVAFPFSCFISPSRPSCLALQGNKKRRLAISREASLPLMLKV